MGGCVGALGGERGRGRREALEWLSALGASSLSGDWKDWICLSCWVGGSGVRGGGENDTLGL